jgi:Zn ribbon nucleic-acid-binding protein
MFLRTAVASDAIREVMPRLIAGSCPVCGGNELAPHQRVRQSEVVKCVSCGLGRTVPTPNASAQDYGTARGAVLRSGERPLWRRFAKTQLELLGPPASDRGRPARLLDVGSSVGALVDEATLRGWCAAGFEPHYDACTIARHAEGWASTRFSGRTRFELTIHVVGRIGTGDEVVVVGRRREVSPRTTIT